MQNSNSQLHQLSEANTIKGVYLNEKKLEIQAQLFAEIEQIKLDTEQDIKAFCEAQELLQFLME